MSITTKTRNWIVGILIAIVGIFLLGWCSGHKKGVNASNAAISALNKEVNRYVVEISNTQNYVTTIEQELSTIKQAKKDGDVTNEELKKLNIKTLNELTRAKLQIDTLLVNITHNGQVIDILNTQIVNYKPAKDSLSKKAILLPFSFEKQDQWLNLNGTFNSIGKLDISLKLDFNADLIAGIDKSSKKNKALLTTDCPYIKTVTFNSIKLDLPKEKKFNVSLFFGYGLTKDLKTSPVLAIGVGRSIFKF